MKGPNSFEGSHPVLCNFRFRNSFDQIEKWSRVTSWNDISIFPFADRNGADYCAARIGLKFITKTPFGPMTDLEEVSKKFGRSETRIVWRGRNLDFSTQIYIPQLNLCLHKRIANYPTIVGCSDIGNIISSRSYS